MSLDAYLPKPGTLYVVATPIGDWRDLTLRARDVLAGVDRIAAEDTRVTAQLLKAHGIDKPLWSVREHNEVVGAARVADCLARGESVAYVTDAGTPAISDPGARVVAAVRAAGHPVVPIPGASALTAALSVAGIDGAFTFFGFMPAKGGERKSLLAVLANAATASVLYEAPHRLRDTLTDLADIAPGRKLTLCKELTKPFEAIVQGSHAAVAAWLDADAQRERGEFVLVLDAAPARVGDWMLAEQLIASLRAELPPAQVAKITAKISGVDRQMVYERLRHTANQDEALNLKSSR